MIYTITAIYHYKVFLLYKVFRITRIFRNIQKHIFINDTIARRKIDIFAEFILPPSVFYILVILIHKIRVKYRNFVFVCLDSVHLFQFTTNTFNSFVISKIIFCINFYGIERNNRILSNCFKKRFHCICNMSNGK